MNRLIDAFEGLFTAASKSGGDLAKTAGFVLENVNWEGQLEQSEPTSQRVVDKHLVAACANSGPVGSSSNKLAEALLAISDQLHWREYTTAHDDEPDIALFLRSYSPATVIGADGLLPSDKVSAGLSMQGHDT